MATLHYFLVSVARITFCKKTSTRYKRQHLSSLANIPKVKAAKIFAAQSVWRTI